MKTKDYFHFYVGCQYQWQDGDGEWRKAQPLTAYQLSDVYRYHINARLILRPLSNMTEEEGSNIMTMIWGIPDSCKYQLELKTHYIRLWQKHHICETTIDLASGDVDSYLGNELQTTTRQHEITKFLLSKGFDIFGLIEAGLAIDKTKL